MAYNKDDKAFLNEAFEKLFRSVGINIGTFTDFLADNNQVQSQINVPTTVYVETTGDDNNPGTASKPFRTIQAAIDRFKGTVINSKVTIQVGVGTFNGFIVEGLDIAAAGSLDIYGTLVSPTLTSGTSSGVITSVSTADPDILVTSIHSDSQQSWSVDQLKYKFFAFKAASSTASFNYFPIISNTSNTVSVLRSGTSQSAVSNIYDIKEPGTIIDGIPSPTSAISSVCICNNNALGAISVRYVKLINSKSASLKYLFRGEAASEFNFLSCLFVGQGLGSTGGMIGFSKECPTIRQCSFDDSSRSSSSFSFSQSTSNSPASQSAISTSYFRGGGGSSYCISGYTSIARLGSGCLVDGYGTAFYIRNQISQHMWSSYSAALGWNISFSIINCNKGIEILSGPTIDIAAVNFFNCTTAITASGRCEVIFLTTSKGILGTCTNGIVLSKGARAQIGPSLAITATNEIVLDGVNYTLANMRAATPKLLTNTYGTIVYE